jgi:tetratricopeptide (TPR) repeat protein
MWSLVVTLAKNMGCSGGGPLDALSESERVLASCAIAREKIEIGNYDDGCAVLSPWWKLGDWPNQEGLTEGAAAELLLMAGSLTDSIARTKRIVGGQRIAESLLSGAIALLDHTAENLKATEARIELACCYYHQGLFDLAYSTLRRSISSLSEEDYELRAVALFRLAILERHRGRLREALALLDEVSSLENLLSPWTKGRVWGEMANILKDFGVAKDSKEDFDHALSYYREASLQFEQLGNLRYVAVVENNRGYLLLSLKRFEESRSHLERARNLFDELGDTVGCAQVDETLAQLYLASERHQFAERSIKLAVGTLEGRCVVALLA